MLKYAASCRCLDEEGRLRRPKGVPARRWHPSVVRSHSTKYAHVNDYKESDRKEETFSLPTNKMGGNEGNTEASLLLVRIL